MPETITPQEAESRGLRPLRIEKCPDKKIGEAIMAAGLPFEVVSQIHSPYEPLRDANGAVEDPQLKGMRQVTGSYSNGEHWMLANVLLDFNGDGAVSVRSKDGGIEVWK